MPEEYCSASPPPPPTETQPCQTQCILRWTFFLSSSENVTRYREIICLEEENSESRLSFFDKNILK
jgi:hypothetical protein